MFGLGTIINTAAIILGGLIGMLFGKKLPERFQKTLMSGVGISVIFLGIAGVMEKMLVFSDGALSAQGSMMLIAKAVLDFIIIVLMAASMGKGCIFSAVPVFVFQGSITLLAKLIEPLLTEAALSNLSMVGSALIFCVGLNLIRADKIKVANLLPSIIVAVIYAFF